MHPHLLHLFTPSHPPTHTRRYTFASDLWSLGCVLYEMAARRPAFEALGLPQLMVGRGVLHRVAHGEGCFRLEGCFAPGCSGSQSLLQLQHA